MTLFSRIFKILSITYFDLEALACPQAEISKETSARSPTALSLLYGGRGVPHQFCNEKSYLVKSKVKVKVKNEV